MNPRLTDLIRRPDTARRGRAGLRVATALLIAGLVVVLPFGAAHAQDEQPPRGGNLSIDITDGTSPHPTATPAPSPSVISTPPPTLPPVLPGPGSPIIVGDVTQATIPDAGAADDALGDAPLVTGNVLAMSGLTATPSPSLGIDNGALTLDFVVRNMSTETFDATARFWVSNIFGTTIADIRNVAVDSLEPDETRRVQVRIDGPGQWIVLRADATLTPPERVADSDLQALSRDTVVVFLPWFLMWFTGLLCVLCTVGWWVFSRRGLGLRLGPVAGTAA